MAVIGEPRSLLARVRNEIRIGGLGTDLPPKKWTHFEGRIILILGGVSMSRRRFDRDFKLSAVKLLESSARPLAQIARSLGIHESMLRRWRNQVRAKGKAAFDDLGRSVGSEVVRLERENRRLKRELEMVKKTLSSLERLAR